MLAGVGPRLRSGVYCHAHVRQVHQTRRRLTELGNTCTSCSSLLIRHKRYLRHTHGCSDKSNMCTILYLGDRICPDTMKQRSATRYQKAARPALSRMEYHRDEERGYIASCVNVNAWSPSIKTYYTPPPHHISLQGDSRLKRGNVDSTREREPKRYHTGMSIRVHFPE